MARGKRWDRGKYPEHWEEMSWTFRASKDFTCEHCGTRQGTLRISRAWNLYPSRVMAAHRYPNDTRNPNPELLCLCERCHFPYDGQFRGIIEEGEHQAVMHGILLDRYGEWEEEVMPMDEGMSLAQFVQEFWGPYKPHRIVDIYRVCGPVQRIWHVYYLHWMRADEYVETALVVYEDESGMLQIGEEQHVYTDEEGVAFRHSLP